MSRRKRERNFFEKQSTTPALVCSVRLLSEIVRGLWSVTLEWIEFGFVHKLYPEEWIA